MKTILIVLSLLMILHTGGLASGVTEIPETNQVILSTGLWKPKPEETQKALVAIQSFLESPGFVSDWAKEEIRKIRDHGKEYRVQFVGGFRKGKKIIRCHFSPAPRKGEIDDKKYWTRKVISVDDGGFWFWRIEFDRESGVCSKFDSNGYA